MFEGVKEKKVVYWSNQYFYFVFDWKADCLKTLHVEIVNFNFIKRESLVFGLNRCFVYIQWKIKSETKVIRWWWFQTKAGTAFVFES